MNSISPINTEITREELIDKARVVSELACSRRAEAERERRMPDEVIDALRASKLMRLCRHKRWGGTEADPMTFLDVGREIARGSGALGWLFSVLGFHEWYMSFASEELQRDVWGNDQDAMVADSYAVVGKTEKVADGYVVNGNWRFCSGIEWSSWIGVGGVCMMPDGEQPEHMLFFVPKSECVIIDDWNTLGLRGTASRTVQITNAFVPNHRVLALGRVAGPNRGKVTEDGPLWRVPLMTMQGLAIMTPSTGLAQRMVDEFTAWTMARVRPYERNLPAKEAPAPQLILAEAATQWDATWALAQKYAQDGWDRTIRGEDWIISDELRAQWFSWRGYIGRSSVELSDMLFTSSGAMALFDTHPMQQVFRDIHSTGVHIGVDRADAYTSRGRVAMGFQGSAFH